MVWDGVEEMVRSIAIPSKNNGWWEVEGMVGVGK